MWQVAQPAFAKSIVPRLINASGNLLGLSGGVDSAVAALLIHRAIGSQLICVFVDTGLLRLHEAEQIKNIFAQSRMMTL